MKRTVVIGASPNSYRYAHQATLRLIAHGNEVIPLGIHTGMIGHQPIVDLRTKPDLMDIHTVTIYLAPIHQHEWMDYILSLSPQRIIFNPGAENRDFQQLANSQKIETINGCTLVMLSSGEY